MSNKVIQVAVPTAGHGPIVAQCEGCPRVIEGAQGKVCNAYRDPALKWSFGACNLATHVARKAEGEVRKVNPLKASKKAAAGGGAGR